MFPHGRRPERPRDREPATTIAWRLAHLIAVFASTSVSRSGEPPADHATPATASVSLLTSLNDDHTVRVERRSYNSAANLKREHSWLPRSSHSYIEYSGWTMTAAD